MRYKRPNRFMSPIDHPDGWRVRTVRYHDLRPGIPDEYRITITYPDGWKVT